MDINRFDTLARSFASGLSRRSMLGRTARAALASPLALTGMNAAAQGNGNNKDKDKDKDKAKDDKKSNADQGGPGNSGCRGEGHPCEGNQVCCTGLTCGPSGPGNALRCGTGTVSTAPQQTGQTTVNQTTNQTVVQNNNQVCAGNCDQNNQQVVDNSLNQAVIAGSPTTALRPPTYWIDLACTFDAPSYRTLCTGQTQGQDGAPLVQKINLPRDRFCAVVIKTESQPERRETVQVPAPVNTSTCLLYTSPSPRDGLLSRMPSSA